MTAVLISLLLAHAPMPQGRRASARFLVTCTVVQRFKFLGTSIAYVSEPESPDPVVVDGVITFCKP